MSLFRLLPAPASISVDEDEDGGGRTDIVRPRRFSLGLILRSMERERERRDGDAHIPTLDRRFEDYYPVHRC